MFNWTIEFSKEGDASSEQVWNTWAAVDKWPEWDSELEWAKLDGPFVKGAKGKLKPKGFFPVTFDMIEAEKPQSFKDVTKMPLGTRVEFHHFLEEKGPQKTVVTHKVSAKGPLAIVLYFTMRRSLIKHLPGALEKLLKISVKN